MKKLLFFIVMSLLLFSCGDGIKKEAVGMFLLPGINYGDNLQELIDKGMKIEFDYSMASMDEDEYTIKDYIYGYNFYHGERALEWCTLQVRGGKIVGAHFKSDIPFDSIIGDYVPRIIRTAMSLEEQLEKEMGAPVLVKKQSMFKTERNSTKWFKNGLEYDISMTPGPENIFFEVTYHVGESDEEGKY